MAEKTGLTARSISNFENQLDFSPSDETLQLLAETLRFPVSFFLADTLDQPTSDTASFRAMKSMSAARQHSVLAMGAFGFALDKWIDIQFEQPTADVPLMPSELPDVAALSLRHHWGLGEQPIKNVLKLLEAKGIRIYSLGNQPREVSAYALWHDGVPFVFLNYTKSAEHIRFALAHELAHLVLHRDIDPNDADARQIEREADRFASAFLMPHRDILAHAMRTPSRATLIQAKKRWGVSVTALAYRLHQLEFITDWHYRNLCIEMSKKGDRTHEPAGLPHETSSRLEKVFSALREDRISRAQIAENLHIFPSDLDELLFGLVPTVWQGEASVSSPSRAHLRVVK
ncbi:helix-turn-helix domain-containing protein [Nitrospirillum viridazoti]|uniref:helix-turn-helix domain-containing protein n=1 Tax=Nitrospirillum viridazoti TaxID=3144925 RepID=UPI001FD58E4D|nr:XRE family transcriptional regulator [Nitrospirillum amazonense]